MLATRKNAQRFEGRRFGMLTAIRRDGADGKGNYFWICICDCGKETRMLGINLKKSNSCGCHGLGSLKDRIERKIIKMENGCWEWQGACNPFGYGHFSYDGKHRNAHKAAYEVYVAPIPNGLFVLHKCDNPKCCNPAHLYLGTPKDNMIDRSIRGRAAKKLTANDIPNIIRDHHELHMTYVAIAKKYGVSEHAISCVVNGKTWAHLRRHRDEKVSGGTGSHRLFPLGFAR